MQPVGFGAHADVPCRQSGTDDDLSEVGIGDDSFGCHNRLMSGLRVCRSFLEYYLVLRFLDEYLAAFLAQVEWSGGIGLIVYNQQDMFLGKTLDVTGHHAIAYDALREQAVIDIDADVFSGEVGRELDVVFPCVGFLFLGIPLEGICQVEEKDGDCHDGNEQNGVESHEILMDIASFSAHRMISFCKTIKKSGKILWH